MPRDMNAIDLLKKDHENVKQLLARFTETTERAVKSRTELLEKIGREVEAHTKVEEEIFYPAFRDAVGKAEERELYFEAVEEHHVVDLVLAELRQCDPGTETYSAKAKVLQELINHHAEEEEKEMFPLARKHLGKDELADLGQAMAARKSDLMAATA